MFRILIVEDDASMAQIMKNRNILMAMNMGADGRIWDCTGPRPGCMRGL